MKNLEQEKLEQLLQIIHPYPKLRLGHFSEGSHTLTKTLSAFCKKKDYEYQLNCIKDGCYDKAITKYKDQPHIHITKFNLDRPTYMIQGKMYEYVFVTATIEKEMRGDFLKKVHGIIKNAGNIIIFLPKGSYEERYDWMALLEEHYYVASNTIDDLFENYDVLISKKMHGWGE
ncbi:hypothetical protein [Sulfurovum sp.]|jgi:hypothetical protein|uniref:hypothetical protein n=1 Tax=Sulfurovum sp. TaxID=1969726 RepID=UPI0025E47CD1|nr:hypothetical protein [Sulfurovum sp.]